MAEKFWVDGYPFQGVVPDAPQPVEPNTELYWMDGTSAIDIFELADTIPYVPPTVTYPQFSSFYGGENCWVDGYPSQGLKTQLLNHTGTITFWNDGDSEEYLFSPDNKDTGKFFTIFEE